MAIKQMHVNLEYSRFPATKIGAKALGTQYFYTGKYCSRDHLALRYTSSGNCLECYDTKKTNIKSGFNGERSHSNVSLALQALEAGQTTYVPENQCKNGHSLRYVGTNNCVECNNITMQLRAKEGYHRWTRIKKEYGLTKEQFFELLEKQSLSCAICDNKFPNEIKNHIDHNHKTGKVRGILCGPAIREWVCLEKVPPY